jgi:hypothetical protein
MQIGLSGFLCFLLEAVKHVDGISELGNVDDPKRPGSIPNPSLLHTLADGVHGLSVVRFLAVLHLIELMACLALGREREGAKVIKGTTPELDGFGIGHDRIIQILVCASKRNRTANGRPIASSANHARSTAPA